MYNLYNVYTSIFSVYTSIFYRTQRHMVYIYAHRVNYAYKFQCKFKSKHSIIGFKYSIFGKIGVKKTAKQFKFITSYVINIFILYKISKLRRYEPLFVNKPLFVNRYYYYDYFKKSLK